MKQRSFFISVVTVFFSLFGFIGQNQTAVAQQSQGMQWALKQMDEDDDGAISRSEAKGRMLANFDRVDQDSSGLIEKTSSRSCSRDCAKQGGREEQLVVTRCQPVLRYRTVWNYERMSPIEKAMKNGN